MYMNNGLVPGKNNNKRGRTSSSSFTSHGRFDSNEDMADDGGDHMDERLGLGQGQGRGAKHGRKSSSFSDDDSGGFGGGSSSSGGGNSRRSTSTSVLSDFVRGKKNERRGK